METTLYSFNGGEFSPYLDGRIDVEKYASGCRRLENFIVPPHGAAIRRPGTQFMAEVKDSTKAVRLIPFEYSNEQAYVLEIGNEYIRFFHDGGQLMSAGVPYELESPYLEAELNQIQFVQSADVMFLVHPLHPPYKLSRLAALSWTLEPVVFDFPPVQDENVTDTTITASAITGEDITLTATAAIFKAGHVGSRWNIVHVREDNELAGAFTKNGASSDDVSVTNTTRRIVLSGTWSGEVKLERSVDSGATWAAVATYTANTDTTATEYGTAILYRITVTVLTSGTVNYKFYVNSVLELDSAFYSTTSSAQIKCSDTSWHLVTHGTWNGTLRVERSFDGGTVWTIYRSYASNEDWNGDVNGSEAIKNVLYRLTISNLTKGTCSYEFTVEDYYVDGIVEISAVAENGLTATADVIQELGNTTATRQWSEASFSDEAGFPCAVTFFQSRLWFGGTVKQPQTVWGSRSNDWLNFKMGDKDDEAIQNTLSSARVNAVRWIIGKRALLVGTSGGEWTVSNSKDGPLTPSDSSADCQSTYGSAKIQALLINDAILFIQRQGHKVREFVYNYQRYTYVCPDLTIMAEHIAGDGIIAAAYQQQPDSILWCITGGGELIGMTYEREQNVVAWYRLLTAGKFESVAVIPGDTEDELWTVVKRTVDGAAVRYVERFAPRKFSAQADAYFVDCGLTYDGVAATVFSGLDHLEGCTVSILADGAYMGETVVTDGAVAIDKPAYVVHIGLKYTSTLKPMKFDLSNGPASTLGKPRTLPKCTVRFLNSAAGKIGTNESNLKPLVFRRAMSNMDAPPPLFTGDYDFLMPGGYDKAGDLLIVQDEPAPMTVMNIIAKWEVGT